MSSALGKRKKCSTDNCAPAAPDVETGDDIGIVDLVKCVTLKMLDAMFDTAWVRELSLSNATTVLDDMVDILGVMESSRSNATAVPDDMVDNAAEVPLVDVGPFVVLKFTAIELSKTVILPEL